MTDDQTRLTFQRQPMSADEYARAMSLCSGRYSRRSFDAALAVIEEQREDCNPKPIKYSRHQPGDQPIRFSRRSHALADSPDVWAHRIELALQFRGRK